MSNGYGGVFDNQSRIAISHCDKPVISDVRMRVSNEKIHNETSLPYLAPKVQIFSICSLLFKNVAPPLFGYVTVFFLY